MQRCMHSFNSVVLELRPDGAQKNDFLITFLLTAFCEHFERVRGGQGNSLSCAFARLDIVSVTRRDFERVLSVGARYAPTEGVEIVHVIRNV